MDIIDFGRQILEGGSLEDKLICVHSVTFAKAPLPISILEMGPHREKRFALTSKQLRFPRGHFHLDDKKAQALNSFANHELLAVEMMACALLIYPHHTEEQKRFKRGILKTLKDEQKHFILYRKRMHDLGYEFGDFPLNDFFWRQMPKLKTPEMFCAVMSLTFEAANLDFASYYKDIFLSVDDYRSAQILDIVLQDEISHVSFGARWLNRWRGESDLWRYYNENLPWPMTPARSKGKVFLSDLRLRSGLEADFVESVENYQDEFKVTRRKEWK